MKDHAIDHKNVVCQDRWSLVTGSIILKCLLPKMYGLSRWMVSRGSGLSRLVPLYSLRKAALVHTGNHLANNTHTDPCIL